jgi:ComF family protein
MDRWKAMLRWPLDQILPPRCPSCAVIVAADDQFCSTCWQQLRFVAPPWCARCNLPFAYAREPSALCGTCLTKLPAHDGVRAAVYYDDIARVIPLRLKYGGKIGLARLIAKALVRHVQDVPADSLLVPVPLHRWRLWSRGFNQSQLIARAIAERTGLRNDPALLLRHKATPLLRGRNAAQRRAAVRDAFALSKRRRTLLKGRTVLLVDDVYTSGATANACAKLLKRGGAERVIILCWARVVSEPV